MKQIFETVNLKFKIEINLYLQRYFNPYVQIYMRNFVCVNLTSRKSCKHQKYQTENAPKNEYAQR